MLNDISLVPLTLGYYHFRGKVQLVRLMCEFLQLPYRDLFLNPDQWKQFKAQEARLWIVKDIPFLQHGSFVLTGVNAMITYVIDLSGQHDLLGRTQADRIKIDTFRCKNCVIDKILTYLSNTRPSRSQEKMETRQKSNKYFKTKITQIMDFHQQQASSNSFYLGYITILDFYMYQAINYYIFFFSNELERYPKLVGLRNRVAEVFQIQDYQSSYRAVKEFCPVEYFRKYAISKAKMHAKKGKIKGENTDKSNVDMSTS